MVIFYMKINLSREMQAGKRRSERRMANLLDATGTKLEVNATNNNYFFMKNLNYFNRKAIFGVPTTLILFMEPFVEQLPLSDDTSFVARTHRTPNFEVSWHQHIEYELILFKEGSG